MPDEQLLSPGLGEAVFPLEIFELIIKIAIDSIDHLSSTNASQLSRSDILSLGIVSRFFADICRPYLFRDVEIHTYRLLDKVQRLAQLIQNKPAIGYYVHNLSYTAAVRNQSPEDTLLDGFLRLPAIKSLTLKGSRRKRCVGETDIPVSNDKLGHRTLLRHYISSNTLTSLHIHNMQNLPTLQIINCPTLEFLSLYSCEYQSCDHPDSAELEMLAKGFNLRSFILRYSRSKSDDGSFFPLLAFCPKLQSIDITKSPNFGHHPKSKFPALAKPLSSFKHVKVIKSQRGVDWTDFCSLADEAAVKAFPSLEDLSFEISDSRDITIGLNVIFNHIRSLIRLSVTS
ncbi:hypothetical protein BJ165DRAFT_1532380 [Panaeolus papilionaceus]|nr:hypothetical protein BJ165DRAFT_1532380 [Panaeolus papilionaceus]